MSSVLAKSSQQSLIKKSVNNHTQEYMHPAVISVLLRRRTFPSEQFMSLFVSESSAEISVRMKSEAYIPPCFSFFLASQSGL